MNPPGREPDAAVMIASLVVGSMNRSRSTGIDNTGLAMLVLTEGLGRRILEAYVP